MGDKIYVPYQEAESEFVEKRSRFIGHIWPVDSEDQAQELIRRVKKQHYDARHNCWCYLLGGTVVRYSDDGEPQGTAGQPMLAVLQRENVTNAVCVVTRYFGGILLGAGGLTRAYGKSARDALAAAGVAAMGRWTAARCTCPYPLLERVKLEAQATGGTVDGIDYGSEVTLNLSLPEDAQKRLQDRLTELSAGRLRLELGETQLRPGPPGRNIARRYNMDDNEKRLEILRRTKKRRKQLDITVILAALAVLFLMAGIYLHQAVYYILFAAALLSAALQVYDLRRTKRQLEEQDRREQEKK